jgi:hypothetical protein
LGILQEWYRKGELAFTLLLRRLRAERALTAQVRRRYTKEELMMTLKKTTEEKPCLRIRWCLG